MSCVDCGRKAQIKTCYGQQMCFECHSNFVEEQEHGREISEEGTNERLI